MLQVKRSLFTLSPLPIDSFFHSVLYPVTLCPTFFQMQRLNNRNYFLVYTHYFIRCILVKQIHGKCIFLHWTGDQFARFAATLLKSQESSFCFTIFSLLTAKAVTFHPFIHSSVLSSLVHSLIHPSVHAFLPSILPPLLHSGLPSAFPFPFSISIFPFPSHVTRVTWYFWLNWINCKFYFRFSIFDPREGCQTRYLLLSSCNHKSYVSFYNSSPSSRQEETLCHFSLQALLPHH